MPEGSLRQLCGAQIFHEVFKLKATRHIEGLRAADFDELLQALEGLQARKAIKNSLHFLGYNLKLQNRAAVMHDSVNVASGRAMLSLEHSETVYRINPKEWKEWLIHTYDLHTRAHESVVEPLGPSLGWVLGQLFCLLSPVKVTPTT
eukprot:3431074-Amphidinium_carterae.1